MNQRKDLWCPKCKKFPDTIKEIYDKVMELRKWDGQCYELIDSNFDSQMVAQKCADCDTELEDREC